MIDKIWDLIIVGLGPAGYTAGIYAKRFNLSVLIIGEEQGGLIEEVSHIENWPGEEKTTGTELMSKMKNQYIKLGGEIKECSVIKLEKNNDLFEVTLSDNSKLKSKTIILATGTKRRKLNIDGETKFFGRGLSYCATCDAPFFKNKVVAIVGGGNSAFTAARHLLQFTDKVYIIHRRNEFRAHPSDIEYMKDKVNFIMNTKIKRIEGKLKVEKLILENTETNNETELNIDGIFVEVGYIPTTTLITDLNVETEDGFIKVNADMSTNVNGLFAAGDCTNGLNHMKQIITAAAMGAIAAESAYKFVNK
jgi:thioredoxin reductase (NADPH)